MTATSAFQPLFRALLIAGLTEELGAVCLVGDIMVIAASGAATTQDYENSLKFGDSF